MIEKPSYKLREKYIDFSWRQENKLYKLHLSIIYFRDKQLMKDIVEIGDLIFSDKTLIRTNVDEPCDFRLRYYIGKNTPRKFLVYLTNELTYNPDLQSKLDNANWNFFTRNQKEFFHKKYSNDVKYYPNSSHYLRSDYIYIDLNEA